MSAADNSNPNSKTFRFFRCRWTHFFSYETRRIELHSISSLSPQPWPTVDREWVPRWSCNFFWLLFMFLVLGYLTLQMILSWQIKLHSNRRIRNYVKNENSKSWIYLLSFWKIYFCFPRIDWWCSSASSVAGSDDINRLLRVRWSFWFGIEIFGGRNRQFYRLRSNELQIFVSIESLLLIIQAL